MNAAKAPMTTTPAHPALSNRTESGAHFQQAATTTTAGHDPDADRSAEGEPAQVSERERDPG